MPSRKNDELQHSEQPHPHSQPFFALSYPPGATVQSMLDN